MLTMTDMHLGGPHPEPGESRSFPGTEITQVGMRTIVAACLTLNITSSPATTDRPEREGTTSCWFGLGIIGLIIWIAIAFWPAGVAARKGHSAIGYFILSLAFFPLALIMAYVVQDRSGLAAA